MRTFLNEKDELVHVQVNGETITCTTEHPFYVQGKGWIAAKDLKIGDKLELQNGEDAFVDTIRREKLAEPIQVFNFEVEDFHTYYVGAGCVLVHNVCSNSPNALGKAGEMKAGIDPNAKEAIRVNNRIRIPDALDHSNKVLTEVKNVRYISNTAQLRDFTTYASGKGYVKVLIVRTDTKVAKTVYKAGWDVVKFL